MLKLLFRIGINSSIVGPLRIKIILSNQIAFIIGFVMLFYFVSSSLYIPQIQFLYVGGVVSMVIGVISNYLGFYSISRFIISITPTWFSLLTYFTISPKPNTGFTEILIISICMLVAPFILFDVRELFLRNLSFLFCILPILFYRQLDQLIQVNVDARLLESTTFGYINNTIALFSMFGFLAVLQATTKKTEDKNKELLLNMESKTKEVEEKTIFLENTLVEVQQAREGEEKRNWIANGLTQINLIMRTENNSEKFYDILISNIVRYIKANQGALYVVEGEYDQKYLNLVACYAFDKKKFIEKRIEIGQGLIGQCYLEKQKIILNKIPENYILITSGLGEANPRCIVIIPFLINGEVQGIIEIASFNLFELYEIEFIEKISENIASALRNNRVNDTTRLLLEESMQQTEEMKAQEEEMRQNMEELQATQEEIERKERDYIARINLLEDEILKLKNALVSENVS